MKYSFLELRCYVLYGFKELFYLLKLNWGTLHTGNWGSAYLEAVEFESNLRQSNVFTWINTFQYIIPRLPCWLNMPTLLTNVIVI